MKDDPMMTTFLPLAASAILLASSGVLNRQTLSKSAPGIGNCRGLEK